MTDREFAEALQARVRAVRALRAEFDKLTAESKAADEAAEGARIRLRELRNKWREAADSLRGMSFGTEPIDPPYEGL